MPATSTRRTQAGDQFVAVTKATKENAQAYLRNNNYNLDAALNQYFAETQDNGVGKAAQATQAAAKTQLNLMFNELIAENDETEDSSADPTVVDGIDAEACEAYIQRLGANPESYEMFVVLEIVQAEVLGRITRTGFVEGWARVMDESQGRVTADWASQKRLVRSRITNVAKDPAYFKTLYDFAFQIGKEPPQKALDMDFALMFWSALFAPTMNSWQSATVDWLDAWKQYLTEKFYVERVGRDGKKTLGWTRTVTKDLWNQTRLFAAKTLEDETLSFWSEEQAWPGLIDDFVVWCKAKGLAGPKNGEIMQVEE